MNSIDSDNLLKELTSVFDNLRAEVIIAEIEENRNESYDYLIKNDSSFTRSYKRDIIDVKQNEEKDFHIFNLSRNGLYDSLPEGFFHGRPSKGQSFVAQRAKYKEEEKQARLLFSPLENEFFNQRLQIEKNERNLLSQFYTLKDDFLIDFWNIDIEIPKEYLLKLVKLLPFAFKIAGDLELTRLCLQEILGVDVSFKKKLSADIVENLDEDNNMLGIDMVLPSLEPEVFTLTVEAVIGPIDNSEVESYLKKDGVLKFVNIFYEYFMPVDIDVFTKIIANSKNGFSLDENEESILGVSTVV